MNIRTAILPLAALALSSCNNTVVKKPNIIVIFTDDQGYQDLGCYGSPDIKTPNIDALAKTGIRFTDFYVTASVCSPSRASLLTGRLSARNGVGGVFFPGAKGMAASEITMAEMLKTAGYKTACYGKWHLGDLDGHLPTDQGFDEYFGIPYSNDMYIDPAQTFAENVNFRNGYTLEMARKDQAFVKANRKNHALLKKKGLKIKSPLFEGKEIVEYPCEQATLTKRYFQRAIDFINGSKEEPFFIYVTPAMPHIPLYASEQFKGTSERGLYGDVIEEIDWNVGQLISHLKATGLDNNTMVIFTSDNGPWLGYKEDAGDAIPLRDGKFTNYEGGVRVPCVMWWPQKWESGKTSTEIISTLDLLPTIAHYTNAELPQRELDGMDISAHLENTNVKVERDVYFHTRGNEIWGIRKGDWKYLPQGGARFTEKDGEAELFNLNTDISETTNLFEQHPDIVKSLQTEIDTINSKIK